MTEQELLALYVEYYRAEKAWEEASKIGSPNKDYLAAAERFQKAKQAMKAVDENKDA